MLTSRTNCRHTNSVDPDQTAPRGAVSSGSTVFASDVLKEPADDTQQMIFSLD